MLTTSEKAHLRRGSPKLPEMVPGKSVGSQFYDFFKTPAKNSEKGTVLQIDNQQFSDFLELV